MPKIYSFLFIFFLCTTPLSITAAETTTNQKKQIPNSIHSSIPSDLPSHWHAKLLNEPILNSKILVIESGQSQRDSVLLIHGLGPNGFKDWLETIKTLESSYHVIALDLPGFGHSSRPTGRLSPKNYAKVLNWLLNYKKIESTNIIGHSMGAAITLQFGALFPSKVKSAVLIDVAGILQRSAFIKHFAQPPIALDFLPENLKRKTFKALHFSDTIVKIINKAPDPTPALQRYDLLWNLATLGKPSYNAALALVETDFSDAIKNFTHPTTIIWGTHDRIAPIRVGKVLAKHLKNAKFHIIPGADHVPMKSKTKQFIAALTQALNAPPVYTQSPHSFTYGKDNLYCENEVGTNYTGKFDNIIFENCTEIKLTNVSARSLTIRNSIVHIDNTTIQSDQTACLFSHSKIIATNIQCIGTIALHSEDDILDFAGAALTGKKIAVRMQGKSQLILSVSNLQSPLYQGSAHGVYKTPARSADTIIDKHF